MTKAQGKHREFSLNQSVATLKNEDWVAKGNKFAREIHVFGKSIM